MTSRLRLALIVCGALGGLAFASSAFAAYTPRLIVDHAPPRLSTSVATLLAYQTGRTDEATAKLVFYVPSGYGVNVGQAPGTQLGTAAATVQARAVSQDIFLPVQGVIQADNPANYTTQATQCTGSPTHLAVWILVLQASGRELRVPLYVDMAAGAETAFAAAKLQVCLPPPDIPEAAGGAAFGAKVVEAALIIEAGVFTTPGSRDVYIWRVIATPWTNFKPPTNAPGTVEGRSAIPLPVVVTLRGRYNKKTKSAVLSGRLTAPQIEFTGATLGLFAGAKASTVKRSGNTKKVKRNGSFTASRKIKRATFFQVNYAGGVGDFTQQVCGAAPPLAPGGCVTGMLTLPQARSNSVKVTPKK